MMKRICLQEKLGRMEKGYIFYKKQSIRYMVVLLQRQDNSMPKIRCFLKFAQIDTKGIWTQNTKTNMKG